MPRQSEPQITIIPPDGQEVAFERRAGSDRLRLYALPFGSGVKYQPNAQRDRRLRRRVTQTQPRRFDLVV